MNLFIGCPIWSFKGWVGSFYPEGTNPSDFLFEYAKRLTTVEGNTTFYAVPSRQTIEGWAEVLPATFRFCAKIPKAISHDGKLTEHIDAARAFVEVMTPLGSRLGPMFLQLPPSYSPHLWADLKTFLERWSRQVRLAVEVRHLGWFDAPHREALNQLLSDHDMARVSIDTRPIRSLEGEKILEGSVYQSLLEARERKPDVPVIQERTADFVFIRYIGHPEMEPNQALLVEWANYLSSQLSAGADAYVFCHSPNNLVAPYLARELHQLVSEKTELPALPWDEIEPNEFEQGKLF